AARPWGGAGTHPGTGCSWEPRARWRWRVLAEEGAKSRRFVFCGPCAAVHEQWLGPGLAVDGPRRNHRHGKDALRRPARPGVHDVTVGLAFGAKKFFIIARCGHGFVF